MADTHSRVAIKLCFLFVCKSNTFTEDSLGSVGGRKQSSSYISFILPHLLALQPWHWRLALQFVAVTSQLQPCVVAELCTHIPLSISLVKYLFPCLQNMLWFNSTVNQSLEYSVPQYKIQVPFWVNSNSLLWVCFFTSHKQFCVDSHVTYPCHSIHTILTWCRTGLSCLHLPKLSLASLAGVAVFFVAVKFVPLDDRAVLLSAAV